MEIRMEIITLDQEMVPETVMVIPKIIMVMEMVMLTSDMVMEMEMETPIML